MQGRDASGAEIAASAKLVVDLDKERFNGNATHIRIPQGQETRHFLLVLGKDQPLTIHKGKGVSIDDVLRPKAGARLFHIRGAGNGTYAIQVCGPSIPDSVYPIRCKLKETQDSSW